MDGGIIEPGGPDEQRTPIFRSVRGYDVNELEVRAAARVERVAADDGTLAGDPYLADALAKLHAAVTDLADTRWAARGPAVLTAALRVLAREQSRLDAATLRLIADVDARDDVVPGAKPTCAGAALLRTALGVERRKASHEAEVARLITGSIRTWMPWAGRTPRATSAGVTWMSRQRASTPRGELPRQCHVPGGPGHGGDDRTAHHRGG